MSINVTHTQKMLAAEIFSRDKEATISLDGKYYDFQQRTDGDIEYNIYASAADMDDGNAQDGGVCTGSIIEAMDMAFGD